MSQTSAVAALPDAPSLGTLREELLEVLDRNLPPGGQVAVIEFPYDANIGNHLMWLAIMRYLRSRGRRVVYVAHTGNHDPAALRRVIGEAPILTSGGVGMTGLWSALTDVRRSVIEQFPDNPLVIMPQTALFQNEEERAALRSAIAGHPAVTIFARDRESARQSRLTYPNATTVLSPDVAFLLGPFRRRQPPEHRIIWLAREDPESDGASVPGGVHRFDWAKGWVDSYPNAHRLLRISNLLSRVRHRAPASDAAVNAALATLYEQASRIIVAGGNRIADTGRVFVTDRFHGHILAALRGQPTVLLPDRFGKNRAFYETWTRGLAGVHWAGDPATALEIANELADGEGDR